MLQLDASPFPKIPRQQTQKHIGTAIEDLEQLPDSRHDRFDATARPKRFKRLQTARLLDFRSQVFDVAVAKAAEQPVVERVASAGDHIRQDDSICPAGNWNAFERVRVP